MAKHNELGAWGEAVAADYLNREGYFVKDRDWHFGSHDIDLVAVSSDNETLVFVEVKTREYEDLSSAEDAVTVRKMRSIALCANEYIEQYNVEMDYRFDVISVIGNGRKITDIRHIADAFNPALL